MADPGVEGSHNGFAKPPGSWVWALILWRALALGLSSWGLAALVLGLSSWCLASLAFANWPLGCLALLVAAWCSDRLLFGRTTEIKTVLGWLEHPAALIGQA